MIAKQGRMFKQGTGDWKQYRALQPAMEIDFHRGERDHGLEYETAMAGVWEDALEALKEAYDLEKRYVLFTHGRSTSEGLSHATARSQVRGLMRGKEATPYIIRKECIQHESVFVAAIRRKPEEGSDE